MTGPFDFDAIRRELVHSAVLSSDFEALVRDWGIRAAKIRTLTSERDGLIRERDCYRSAWRIKSGLPPLPGVDIAWLDPVPPVGVGVLDEEHVWLTEPVTLAAATDAPVCPPQPLDPTPAGAD